MVAPKFAAGKRALAICDRCGHTKLLSELKAEVTHRRITGMKVCGSCFDGDHPQNFTGERVPVDAVALRDPRPDTGRDESRVITGEVVFPPVNGWGDGT